MPKPRSKSISRSDDFFPVKKRKPVPHEFVLDALAAVSPRTNPMFGCLAVYVSDKIVFILRDRPTAPADNGVWLATTVEHHESLRADFPCMRSIGVFGKDVTGWQILPADASDFEEAALLACELVIRRDPRIGKVPKSRRAQATIPRRQNPQNQASQDENPSRKNQPKKKTQKKKIQPKKKARKKKIQPKKKTKKRK